MIGGVTKTTEHGTEAPAPMRRSQAERSETTRAALLEATIASLAEDGYENTTTGRVAERAGVSRGAHLHHFQTRAALVAAAAEHLTERRNEQLLAAAEGLPAGGRERVLEALDLLWRSYESPLFQAALDLWTSARTDPELRAHLVVVERDFDRNTLEVVKRLFPGQGIQPGFHRAISVALATMRGLALLDTLHPGEGRGDAQWRGCRTQLAELVDNSAAAPAA